MEKEQLNKSILKYHTVYKIEHEEWKFPARHIEAANIGNNILLRIEDCDCQQPIYLTIPNTNYNPQRQEFESMD